MTLTIYICLRFLRGYLWSFLSVVFLILLIDGSDQLNFMASNNIAITAGIKNTFFRTPSILMDAMPLVIMLAGLSTFINLSRSSELVIIRSAGRSALRILFAPLALTLIFGVFCTMVGNPLVSSSIKYSENFLQDLGLKPRNFMSVTGTGIWLREKIAEREVVIKADQTNLDGSLLFNLTIFEFDREDTLRRRISAESGELMIENWQLKNVVIWSLSEKGPMQEAFKLEKKPSLSINTTLSKSQILDSFADPKAINFWILPSFIEKLESSGFSAIRHKLFFQSEISRPLFFIAMLLIGAGFALRHARFGQTGVLVILSVTSGFLLFSIKRISESLGAAGEIPLFLAAFGPSVSGILFAVGLLLHLEDG